MTEYYIWNGQALELDPSDLVALHRYIVQRTNRMIAAPAAMLQQDFDRHRAWRSNIYGVDFVREALGGAEIPKISRLNNLRRTENRLRGYVGSLRTTIRFFERLPRWERSVRLLRRDMNAYRSEYFNESVTIARNIELTRDGSFMALQVMAGIATGGTSAVAATGLRASMTVLGRQVAMGALTSAINRTVRNLSRTMSGEQVTMGETASDLVSAAIDGMSGAMIGSIFSRWTDTMTRPLSDWIRAEIDQGRVLRGVGMSIADNQIQNAVQAELLALLSNSVNEVRAIVQSAMTERDDRAASRSAVQSLTRNRRFRSRVDERLQRDIGR